MTEREMRKQIADLTERLVKLENMHARIEEVDDFPWGFTPMAMAADIAEDFAWKDDELSLVNERWVARIHDIGKPRCKTFTDRNGNATTEAHYYGHQNYSAYYSLIFDNSDFDISLEDSLDNACLIQWHMEHYLRDPYSLSKFYKMIGPKLLKRLTVLEKADKAAH